MFSKMKIALATAIVLGTAFSASASTKARATHANPAIHNMGPNNVSDRCPPSGGPSCSDACLPSGPPCRTAPDGW
jgi:hypothetical protein